MRSVSAKRVWTANGWLSCARVLIEDGIITGIEQGVTEKDCDVPVLIPGMIEVHVHGSMGYNASTPTEEENAEWLQRLAAHGVTGVVPTLSSSPAEVIRHAVAFYDGVMQQPIAYGARVLGVHLEGPFLCPEKKGGINPLYLRSPSVEHYRELTGEHSGAVCLITLAPELENSSDLIVYLKQSGVCVSAGHSNATVEQMRAAIACGLDGVTHFFNAARPITHRDPGFLTAALLDDSVFCEMVCDLVHLAPEIILLLVKLAGPTRLVAVTDAVTLTGLPDGHYGDRMVVNGSPRLENGTLTGGRYLMDDCARALIGIGVDPFDVFYMTSHTPAKRLGMNALGDIAPLHRADLVAMDEDYRVRFTMIGGKKIQE